MSHKREHSVGGRQYAKRKRMAEKQEGPTKKSQCSKEKQTTEPARTESPQPTEQSQDSSDSRELPDVPWTQTKRRSQKIHGMPTWNHPLHHIRIPDHEDCTTANET